MLKNALHRSGKGLGVPGTTRDNVKTVVETARDDHFIVKNGARCAGAHLIVDLYQATRLDDLSHI